MLRYFGKHKLKFLNYLENNVPLSTFFAVKSPV